jgi:alkaline phosphatase
VQAVIKEGWALDITDEEARKILANASSRSDDAYFAIGEVLCPQYTYVGWTTHGHAGGDVPLFAFGPGKPGGILEAPDIARVCASAMGLDLARLNERLFVDAAKAFADGRVGVDKSDPANPVVKIDYRGRAAELPVNKNFLKLGERMFPLEGVVVYAPATGRAYIPLQAVRMIRGEKAALPRIANW